MNMSLVEPAAAAAAAACTAHTWEVSLSRTGDGSVCKDRQTKSASITSTTSLLHMCGTQILMPESDWHCD